MTSTPAYLRSLLRRGDVPGSRRGQGSKQQWLSCWGCQTTSLPRTPCSQWKACYVAWRWVDGKLGIPTVRNESAHGALARDMSALVRIQPHDRTPGVPCKSYEWTFLCDRRLISGKLPLANHVLVPGLTCGWYSWLSLVPKHIFLESATSFVHMRRRWWMYVGLRLDLTGIVLLTVGWISLELVIVAGRAPNVASGVHCGEMIDC